jgi:hypothetical protein
LARFAATKSQPLFRYQARNASDSQSKSVLSAHLESDESERSHDKTYTDNGVRRTIFGKARGGAKQKRARRKYRKTRPHVGQSAGRACAEGPGCCPGTTRYADGSEGRRVTDSDWTRISAIGQAAAAVISMFALVGLFFQIRMTRKAADLKALQDFVQSADDHETRLLDAETETKQDQAFFEFLDFLESNAGAFNDNLFPKTTKRFVKGKIRDSIATIQGIPAWHRKFEQAITTNTTFAELAKFMKRYRVDINRVVAMRAALAASENAPVQIAS